MPRSKWAASNFTATAISPLAQNDRAEAGRTPAERTQGADWASVGCRRRQIDVRGSGEVMVPSREQFRRLMAAIRNSDGNSIGQAGSKEGADLVEFLAYSGARVGESRFAPWSDVNFEANTIWNRIGRGHPDNQPLAGPLRRRRSGDASLWPPTPRTQQCHDQTGELR